MRPTNLIKILVLVVLGLAAVTRWGYTRPDSDSFYTIQMASFQQEQSAVDAVERLKPTYRDVFYRPIQIADKGTWYRLYINRYATIQSAQAGITELRKEGIISEAYVRRLEDTPGIQTRPAQQKHQPLSRAQGGQSAKPEATPEKLQKLIKVTSPEPRVVKGQRDPLKIRDVVIRRNDKDGDTAYIQADRYFWPVMRMSQDGGRTNLEVQIQNSAPFQKDLSLPANSGSTIQNGRVTYDSERNTLVLSLDLSAQADYRVTQLFNQTDNIFSLLITQ